MQPEIVNRRLDILSGHITPQAGMIEGVDCAATAHSQADYDVIVFGAGAVGCAIAIALGKQGRKVLICERDMSEPDRIVGELLQPGAIDFLKQIGIEHVLDEVGGVAEKGYAVFYKGEIVHLPYPQGRQGCSFHFGKLIMSLRKAAQATPNVEIRQATVKDLIQQNGVVHGVVTTDETNNRIYAPLTLVVDGCNSHFRERLGASKPVATSSFVGLILNMPVPDMPFPHHGHVILADPSPILLYAVSMNEIRILIDVPHPMPQNSNGDLQRYLEAKVTPQLPEPCRQPFLTAVREGRIRSMPNKYMPGRFSLQPGAMLIGDSLNMRHPLTGGGMMVGWSDVVHLRNALNGVDLYNRKAVARAQQRFISARSHLSTTTNVLSLALYKVFTPSDDPVMPYMRDACFAYFQLGGRCAAGPIGLISGLSPNYYMLLAHFFAVALYACFRAVTPLPWPSRVFLAVRLLKAATGIVMPLIAMENVAPFKYVLKQPAV